VLQPETDDQSVPDQGSSPAEIAQWATDEDRLMSGENPRSPYPSDAEHWVKVYSELIALKDELIAVARRGVHTLDAAGSKEIEHSDILLLQVQRDRFLRRLDFWTARQEELGA
jgi:hypothetical protein